MILVIGGAYQGKTAHAKTLLTDSMELWDDLHLWVKEQLQDEKEPRELVADMDLDNKVIVCNELGSGIVPMDPLDRTWRETTGRVCCDLAKTAEAVYRVNCGIAQRIK